LPHFWAAPLRWRRAPAFGGVTRRGAWFYPVSLMPAALTIQITGESYRGVKARKLASKKKEA
jgi:hypothetical protein